MTAEPTAPTLADLVRFAQLGLSGRSAHAPGQDARHLAPRDEPRPRTGAPSRRPRSIGDHVESLGAFVLAGPAVTVPGRPTGCTALLARVVSAARGLPLPACAPGLAPWRSLVWSVGWTAMVATIAAAALRDRPKEFRTWPTSTSS